MAHRKLKNYIRKHRKAIGLSQDELAFLLGCERGSRISRYENFLCDPLLMTALACEFIFQVPVRELFAGVFEEAAVDVTARMRALEQVLDKKDPGTQAQMRQRGKVEAFLQRRLYLDKPDEFILF